MEVNVTAVQFGAGGEVYGQVDGGDKWISVFTGATGCQADLIIEGYNTKERVAIKGQSGHQMMLLSDMVLLWDADFKKHLVVYAEDEELLRQDFAAAFKRLTELGCPWQMQADDAPQPATGEETRGAMSTKVEELKGQVKAKVEEVKGQVKAKVAEVKGQAKAKVEEGKAKVEAVKGAAWAKAEEVKAAVLERTRGNSKAEV